MLEYDDGNVPLHLVRETDGVGVELKTTVLLFLSSTPTPY
jgi:hypothetical protein